ncbi:MAG: hypothetical protein NVS2B8_01480 [Vulcanimicrobiaceae bacterium]
MSVPRSQPRGGRIRRGDRGDGKAAARRPRAAQPFEQRRVRVDARDERSLGKCEVAPAFEPEIGERVARDETRVADASRVAICARDAGMQPMWATARDTETFATAIAASTGPTPPASTVTPAGAVK